MAVHWTEEEYQRHMRRQQNSARVVRVLTKQKPPQTPTAEQDAPQDFADVFLEKLARLAPDIFANCVPEFRFAKLLPRDWRWASRFDAAWPVDPSNPHAGGVAVEIDGGRWESGGGRHATEEDMAKLNLAAILGWRVLRFQPGQLGRPADDMPFLSVLAVVREALRWQPGLPATHVPTFPLAWRADIRREERKRKEEARKKRQELKDRAVVQETKRRRRS